MGETTVAAAADERDDDELPVQPSSAKPAKAIKNTGRASISRAKPPGLRLLELHRTVGVGSPFFAMEHGRLS